MSIELEKVGNLLPLAFIQSQLTQRKKTESTTICINVRVNMYVRNITNNIIMVIKLDQNAHSKDGCMPWHMSRSASTILLKDSCLAVDGQTLTHSAISELDSYGFRTPLSPAPRWPFESACQENLSVAHQSACQFVGNNGPQWQVRTSETRVHL